MLWKRGGGQGWLCGGGQGWLCGGGGGRGGGGGFRNIIMYIVDKM